MEPRAVVAQWIGDEVTLWSATQIPHVLRFALSAFFGIPEQNVRVIAPDVGGGFGSKLQVTAEAGSVAVTAATGDTNPSGVDGNQTAQLTNGEYLAYPGINFGSGSSEFDARVASGAPGGVSGLVEVVLDNPSNAPAGSFAVGNTGGWSSWRTIPANISTVNRDTHRLPGVLLWRVGQSALREPALLQLPDVLTGRAGLVTPRPGPRRPSRRPVSLPRARATPAGEPGAGLTR